MNADTFFWLFSTIAQTYGAILGVIGMLTVYKFQILSNTLTHVFERADSSLDFILTKKEHIMSHETLVEIWTNDNFPLTRYNRIEVGIIEITVHDIKRINKVKKNIAINFKRFFIVNFAIIICSILFITVTNILPNCSRLIIIFTTAIEVVISFIATYKLCMSLLEE